MPAAGGKILIVDDEPANTRLLEIILEGAGYHNTITTNDSREVVSLFARERPDLLMLDLNMPHVTGQQILRLLQPLRMHDQVPVLVLTADATSETKHFALREGANDFLTKPFDQSEVLLRIKNLLQVRLHNVLLEETVRQRTSDLERAQFETVQTLAIAAEYRDDQTGLHAKRVGVTSALLANCLGQRPREVEYFAQAAALHDVGKIGVPDSILLKPGKLTEQEFEEIKQHTVIGAKILSGSNSLVFQLARQIAEFHHEHWNGKGYWGLAGEDIPLPARIVAVADAFDAMTHERPYKEAMEVCFAVREILNQSGTQFDPRVVDAFAGLQHEELV